MSATTPPISRARLAVLAVFATNGLIMASWVSRVPTFRDRFTLADQQVGLVLLSVSAGAVLALPATGAVIGRLGARTTVRLGCLVATVGLAIMALAPSTGLLWLLVAGMFATGIGSGSWDVAMNVEAAEVERRLGRSVMPHFHASFSIGTVAGALLGAGANAVHVPVGVHLIVIAALCLVGTQLACFGFLPVVAAPAGTAAEHPRRHPLSAWTEPRVLAIGLLVLCFAFTEGSANDWLALGLVDGYHVSNAYGVAGFAVFVAAMTLGRMSGPFVLDRYGRVVVLRLTALCAAAGVLVVVFAGLPWALLGAAVWGLGASLGFPVGMSAGADDPARAAARVSVVSSIGYTAFLAGPPFIGFLAAHVGILHALLAVLAVLVVGAAAASATRPVAARR
ncbi:MAG: MFS transporter [Nocardioidaceae bacterium]